MNRNDLIENYLLSGNNKKAISALREVYNDTEIKLIESRFKKLENDNLKGLVSNDEYRSQYNKITNSILNYFEKRKSPEQLKEVDNVKSIIRITAISVIIISLIGLAFLVIKNQILLKHNQEFKVLFLPFNPYKSCSTDVNNYESVVFARYDKINAESNLNMTFQFYDPEDCLLSIDRIRSIGELEHADVIMWGKYIEGCTDSVAKINYQFTSISYPFATEFAHEFDTFYNVQNIIAISDGENQEALDYQLFRSLAIHNLYNYEQGGGVDAINAYFELKEKGEKLYSNNVGIALGSLSDCWIDVAQLLRDVIKGDKDESLLDLFLMNAKEQSVFIEGIEDEVDMYFFPRNALLKVSILLEIMNSEQVNLDISGSCHLFSNILNIGDQLFEALEDDLTVEGLIKTPLKTRKIISYYQLNKEKILSECR